MRARNKEVLDDAMKWSIHKCSYLLEFPHAAFFFDRDSNVCARKTPTWGPRPICMEAEHGREMAIHRKRLLHPSICFVKKCGIIISSNI